jgi:hypothetical protein
MFGSWCERKTGTEICYVAVRAAPETDGASVATDAG